MLEEIVVADPGPGAVPVRIQASGVGYTDRRCKLGKITRGFLCGKAVAAARPAA